MDTYEQILRYALLGSSRAEFPVPNGENKLSRILREILGMYPEDAPLPCMSIATHFYHAGRLAERASSPLPPPAMPEEKEPCSEVAAYILKTFIQEEYWLELREWLTLASVCKQICPPRYIPDLFAVASKKRELCPLVLAACGKRGVWLAKQNPVWDSGLLPHVDGSIWDTGSLEARCSWLKKERRNDTDLSRKLLNETLQTEKATDRASLIECLAVNLSEEDAPLLKTCLLDRSKEVRQRASRLLAKLSNSDYSLRMLKRAQNCLQLSRKMLRRRLEVQVPDSYSAELAEDGLTSGAVKYPVAMGEGASLFYQIVSLIPPSHWSNSWQLQPKAILKLATETDYGEVLKWAWAQAAMLHGDRQWIIQLREAGAFDAILLSSGIGRLLPPDVYRDVWFAFWEAEVNINSMYLYIGLMEGEQVASPTDEHREQIFNTICQTLTKKESKGNIFLPEIDKLATLLPFGAYDRLEPALIALGEYPPSTQRNIENLMKRLKLRQEMKKEFSFDNIAT